MMRRRVSAVLAGLTMMAALIGCGDDGDSPGDEHGPAMMRSGQPAAGADADGSVDWLRKRHQMQHWCDDLLDGQPRSELDQHQRAATMRRMHERMNRQWGESSWPLMMSGQVTSGIRFGSLCPRGK